MCANRGGTTRLRTRRVRPAETAGAGAWTEPEDDAGEQRAPDATPSRRAEDGEHEAAEEDLLDDRREHADQQAAGDQDGERVLGLDVGRPAPGRRAVPKIAASSARDEPEADVARRRPADRGPDPVARGAARTARRGARPSASLIAIQRARRRTRGPGRTSAPIVTPTGRSSAASTPGRWPRRSPTTAAPNDADDDQRRRAAPRTAPRPAPSRGGSAARAAGSARAAAGGARRLVIGAPPRV